MLDMETFTRSRESDAMARARRLLNCHQDAEDAVWGAFFGLHKWASRLGDEAESKTADDFRAVFFAILRRRASRMRVRGPEVPTDPADLRAVTDSRREEGGEERRRLIERLLTVLPEAHRRMVRLRLQGASAAEASQESGLGRSAYSHALAWMRQAAEEMGLTPHDC